MPTSCVSINTAGKALGVGGAFVAGPAWAIDYLVQRARPFVFSTAPPPALADALDASLDVVAATNPSAASGCGSRVRRRPRAARRAPGFAVPRRRSQIVPVVIGDNDRAVAVAARASGRRVRRPRHPAAQRAAGHRAASRLGQRRPVRRDARSLRRVRSRRRSRRPASAPRSLRNRHRHGRRQDRRLRGAAAPLSASCARSATGSRFRPASSRTTTRRGAAAVGAAAPTRMLDAGVRLPRPVSPHLAARLSGIGHRCSIADRASPSASRGDRWIVEGAGGVLVPLNEQTLMVDLIAPPAAAGRRRRAQRPRHDQPHAADARSARRRADAGRRRRDGRRPDRGEPAGDRTTTVDVPVVGELPRFDPLTPDALAAVGAIELSIGTAV